MAESNYMPENGDTVMVTNNPNIKDGDTWHVQRFVIYHNDTYYCERDDGDTSRLIGWRFCFENERHELHETKPKGFDDHYVKPYRSINKQCQH